MNVQMTSKQLKMIGNLLEEAKTKISQLDEGDAERQIAHTKSELGRIVCDAERRLAQRKEALQQAVDAQMQAEELARQEEGGETSSYYAETTAACRAALEKAQHCYDMLRSLSDECDTLERNYHIENGKLTAAYTTALDSAVQKLQIGSAAMNKDQQQSGKMQVSPPSPPPVRSSRTFSYFSKTPNGAVNKNAVLTTLPTFLTQRNKVTYGLSWRQELSNGIVLEDSRSTPMFGDADLTDPAALLSVGSVQTDAFIMGILRRRCPLPIPLTAEAKVQQKYTYSRVVKCPAGVSHLKKQMSYRMQSVAKGGDIKKVYDKAGNPFIHRYDQVNYTFTDSDGWKYEYRWHSPTDDRKKLLDQGNTWVMNRKKNGKSYVYIVDAIIPRIAVLKEDGKETMVDVTTDVEFMRCINGHHTMLSNGMLHVQKTWVPSATAHPYGFTEPMHIPDNAPIINAHGQIVRFPKGD